MLSLKAMAHDSMSVQQQRKVHSELECLVLWFQKWSDVQKADFMKELVAKVVPAKVSTLLDAFSALDTTMTHKSPSMFQCQMKLFNDWFSNWTDNERNHLLVRLESIDADFVNQLNAEVAATSGQP